MIFKHNSIAVVQSDCFSFPCNSCGKCCQNVNLSSQTDYLDRGDGTCRHFDDKSMLCTIYEERPLICRVEEYYKQHLSSIYQWDEFVKMNLEVCEKLQKED